MPPRPDTIAISLDSVSRRFGRRLVFSDISLELKPGQSLAVTGPNGSGKTTLLRIIAGLDMPSSGKVHVWHDSVKLERAFQRRLISYVGPEMTLYNELTAAENLTFFSTMRGAVVNKGEIEVILDRWQLGGRADDFYRAYSSGMKQRLKYAVAELGRPRVFLLDEPTANLDNSGKDLIRAWIDRKRSESIIIIATNEEGEYRLADSRIDLGS